MAARKQASPLIVFLVIGIFVGAIAGYLTRPESTEIRLGPLNVEITGNKIARDEGPLTGAQMRYIGMVTLIGAALGLALGYGVQSGRFRI